MNSSNNDKAVFRYLLTKSIDGQITPSEIEQLNNLWDTYPDLEKYYFDNVLLQCLLPEAQIAPHFNKNSDMILSDELFLALAEQEKNAHAIELPKEKPPRDLIQKVVYPPRGKYKMTKFNIFSLVACAAMILFFVYLRFTPQKPYSVEVATLVDQMNVQWADSGVTFKNGERLLTNQKLSILKNGIVKIQYDDKVEVLVEGPAEFQIEAEDRIGLRYGKVYSIVPTGSIGFSVYTPSAKIIDMGTEFGVQAEIDGETQLQVFKGKTMLLYGKNDSKYSMEVGAGDAKRISTDTHEVTDIPYDKTRFVHGIDSQNNFIWKGKKSLDLADIVNGGNGFGTGRKGFCIMPDTGRFTATEESPLGSDPSGVTKLQSSYMRAVPELAAVDCVIVPGYRASGDLPLSTTGLSIPDFPELTGSLRWRIQTQSYDKGTPLTLNGTIYGVDEHPAILMHANCGITFDLDKIRQSISGLGIVSFKALCGICERNIAGGYDPERTADVRIFLDGREVFYQSLQHVENNAVPIEIDLTEGTARFMTWLVTCGTQSNDFDSCVFGAPELILEGR